MILAKDPLIHFPFYIYNYLGRLSQFTFEERGMFITMLCIYLAEDGQIENEALKRRLNLKEENHLVIFGYLLVSVQELANEIIEEQKNKRDKKRANGMLGGRPKYKVSQNKKPIGYQMDTKWIPNGCNQSQSQNTESESYIETYPDTELKKENILPIVPLQKKETAKINFALDFEKLSSEDQKLTYKTYQEMRSKAALSHEQIQDYLDKFNEFWINYTPIEDSKGGLVPRGDKKDCRVKYLRLLHAKESHEEIMKGLASYLKLCLKSGRQSCGIAVFMNQRRWEGLEDLNSVKAAIPKPKSRICDWMDEPDL